MFLFFPFPFEVWFGLDARERKGKEVFGIIVLVVFNKLVELKLVKAENQIFANICTSFVLFFWEWWYFQFITNYICGCFIFIILCLYISFQELGLADDERRTCSNGHF